MHSSQNVNIIKLQYHHFDNRLAKLFNQLNIQKIV